MATKGKMNKAQLFARVEELENKIEEWKATLGGDFETPQDIILTIKELTTKNQEQAKVINEIKEIYQCNDAHVQSDSFINSVKEREEIYDKHTRGDYIETDDLNSMEEIIAESGDRCVVDTKALEALQDFHKARIGQAGVSVELWNKKIKECDNWKEKFINSEALGRSEKQKVRIYHEWAFNDDNFAVDTLDLTEEDDLSNANKWLFTEIDKNHSAYREGYHWEFVHNHPYGDYELQHIKNKETYTDKWIKLQESGDADPEYLLNAIAEKFGLTPIEWGKPGCFAKSGELWDKIMDEAQDR